MSQRFGIESVQRMLLATLLCALPFGIAGAIGIGETAPDFTLTDLDGQDHTLSAYTSPVLLMFFSCDADVSIALAPLVQGDIYEPYSEKGLRVLGIECHGSTLEQAARFRNETGARYPLLLDGQSTQSDYDVPVSSFVLVDGSGKVRYVGLGPGDDAYDPSAILSTNDDILRETNARKEATWGLIKSLYSD